MPNIRNLQVRKGIAKGVVLLFYIAIFHIFVNTSSGSIEQYLSASPPHLYLKHLAEHVSWLPTDSNLWLTVVFVTVVINSLVLLTWVITQVIFLVLCMEILTKRRWSGVMNLLAELF
ncbi:hypothetical protein B0I72DRAFT_126308 [Yarrowia lipolytica]|jgi:hypothetical protein|uniref:YALI0A02629p n=2 Tax=Yarrowia lipolytica TaxID=4952 RepID=Q6CI11_YARLI|nr:YALI0A02629p [Yarrowia lipolytica CLIB122]AOW00187.1 hypothetical protein YALI1_A03137g [Yarrowia lipolytica]KAB8284245.1 hypothetical protein BKA91DRAFT_151237 [Yarrowia lipolytica]KAE8169907.1 hypothetical protein BKA90DRAFT_148990 [Yarrowia lipolytica]KAJ8051309.1 hypothetical protein LXG23DRAFT_50908 [Yarrowia lipolytica]QNP95648.1 Hypothetical protein YALI2_A00647g [Yarrowia lipolytica]|eukprot:XP_499700.2 YALI0A02629p [Yarrowia lipolytica CLIB122]